ncbi:MAG TPA: DUF2142 domain-containing protein [Anaerolineales bacterium]|nr:DUF2142 domain-containing protein [Anaerolineales bacterium]
MSYSLLSGIKRQVGQSKPLLVLLALVMVRGILYAFISPPWLAPDEPTHYHYMAALAVDPQFFPESIPVLPEVYAAVWDNASKYRIWDYNDWPIRGYFQELEPNGRLLTRAGGLYYRYLFPVYGLTRSWPLEAQAFALRVWSSALMIVTVVAVYGIARTILNTTLQRDRALAWSAAALVGLHPMAMFISASVNDDNLVTPLAALTLLGVLRALHNDYQGQASTTRWWWTLASVCAIGSVLSKRTGYAAVGFVAIGVFFQGIRWATEGRSWRRWIGWSLVVIVLGVIVGAGVLIGFHPLLPSTLTWRIQLPADFLITLSNALGDVFNQPWQNWYSRLMFFTLSFWGWFGWMRAPLGLTAISLLRWFSLLVALGMIVQVVIWVRQWRDRETQRRLVLSLVLIASMAFNFSLLLAQHLVMPEFYILTGRYFFPALGAWGALSVIGWSALWPRRWTAFGLQALIGLAVALDVYAWLFVMIPFFYA